MEYITARGQSLSRFSLGAVQLGMTYGLSAKNEKPSEEDAFQLLDRAFELGVNNIDTANNYGDSEAVIGRWLERRRKLGLELPWVVTKIGPLRHGSYDNLRDDVMRQVEQCRRNLGTETIDCLMLHNFEDYGDDRDNMQKIFRELKEQKLCNYSAISAYSRHDYGVIAESGFDATQIPLNVFDWKQIENGGIEKLRKAGMMVFVRSAFLQGLVFRKPEDLDPRMAFCAPAVARFRELCEQFDMSPAVLALSFVFSVPGVTTAVLGCRNIHQAESNCALMEQVTRLTPEQMNNLRKAFLSTEERITNPGLWFNHT